MFVTRKQIQFILASAITLASILFLIRTLDFDTVVSELTKVNYCILIFFIPIFVLNMICRTIRWRLIIGKDYNIHFISILCALLIGNFYNSVLPARAGDIVRSLFLSSKTRLCKMHILASVFVERLLDLFCVMLSFFILANILDLGEEYAPFIPYIFAAICFFIIFFIFLAQKKYWKSADKILMKYTSTKIHTNIKQLTHAFLNGIKPLFTNKSQIQFFMIFISVWFLELFSLQVIVFACTEVEVAFYKIAALYLFPTFAAFLPAAPAQIGIFESAVIVGSEVLNIEGGASIALVWHGISLLCIIIAGAVALLLNIIFTKNLR